MLCIFWIFDSKCVAFNHFPSNTFKAKPSQWFYSARRPQRRPIDVFITDICGNCSAYSRTDRRTDNCQRPQSNMSNGPDRMGLDLTPLKTNADWAEDPRSSNAIRRGIWVWGFFFWHFLPCPATRACNPKHIDTSTHTLTAARTTTHAHTSNAFKRKLSLTSKN